MWWDAVCTRIALALVGCFLFAAPLCAQTNSGTPAFSGVIGGAAGTTAARFAQPLDVVGSANYAGMAITDWTAGAADQSPLLDINRSKSSTPGTFTAVAAADTLGYLSFRGSDGTQFVAGATIKGTVGATVGANQVPGNLLISTADATGTMKVRQTFDFRGHTQTSNTPPSGGVPTSCGTGSPTVIGSDEAGLITTGTAATTCVITFTVAHVLAPFCTVTSQTQLASFTYAITNTTISITNTSASGDLINYMCKAQAGG